MFGVEALPLVHSFSLSEKADERALFVRVYLDLRADRACRNDPIPEDWFKALQACLGKADAREREVYLADLAKTDMRGQSEPRREAARADVSFAFATRDDIDAVVKQGGLDELIALTAARKARLRPDHLDSLVPRARALAESGDRRLADALLSRDPIRLQAAHFLEANAQQRAAILLAAQRADLGRRASAGALRFDAEVASRLEFAAIAGDAGEFTDALGAALGAEPDLAARIAADPTGEPLAVALIALGAPRDVAVRIVTVRDMQEGEGFPRIHTLARLSEQVSAAAALRIVAALVGPAPLAAATPARAAPAPREAANPSPFLRRDGHVRKPAANPETSARSALNNRTP